MKVLPLFILSLVVALPAVAQEVPGGKSLAELVRERFEAKPPRRNTEEDEKDNEEEKLPPAPPVTAVSLGPKQERA